MKIATTVLSIPLTMALSAIVFAAVSLSMTSNAINVLNDSAHINNKIIIINELRYNLSMMRGDVNTLDSDISAGSAPSQKYLNDYTSRKKFTEEQIAYLRKITTEDMLKDIESKAGELIKIYDFSISQIESNKNATTSTSSRLQILTDLIKAEIEKSQRQNSLFLQGIQNNNKLLKFISSAFIFLSVLLLAFSFYIASHKIKKKIAYIVTMFSGISTGHLSTKIDNEGKNEFDDILMHMEIMRSSLVNMISAIKENVVVIRDSSSEISRGNDELSSRTDEQASAIQQTAASMEQMKTATDNNTENAKHANTIATNARKAAEEGALVMGHSIASMKRIEDGTARIAEFTNVINDIANQTNILALNAAVEAARAGEQGRGFAVVSSEVRNLATKSAEAAAQISHIIRQSVEDISQGTGLVYEAEKSMQTIVDSVHHFSDLMEGITLASEEQKTGIHQVTAAMNQIDMTTQHNAALVEQAAAVTSNLDEQAQSLSNTVLVFQTGHEN